MKPDTTLTLGDFVFAPFEIPERIGFGGEQKLVTHELVGGARVVDAMGRSDRPLEWSGMFLGANALLRARYLDGLRVAGQAMPLKWGELAYFVVISSFLPEYERAYKIPYKITCHVIRDLTRPVLGIADSGVDGAIREDSTLAGGLGDLIGDSTLTGLLGTLDSAISTVSDFANAAQSVINGVLAPIAAVQGRITTLISSTGNTINNIATLGGILPNTPISQSAFNLTSQVAAMTQMPQLYNLQSVVGRMGANLSTIGGGVRTITQAGGNLFQMAEVAYGDATSWTAIARANGIADPFINGIASLVVPAIPDSLGGILSA